MRFGIQGYPTLKYFPKGSTDPTPYEAGRSEAAFVKFLNEKAGTNRAVGGGLNELAGRIEAFDNEILQLVRGDADSLKAVSEKIEELAKNVTGKYAPYYIKALVKLASNEAYVEREYKRLEGILKRGGLASTKADELRSKANILSRFFVEKTEKSETEKVDAKDEL